MIKPFPYFGGKHKLTPRLLPLIPPHTLYVEVFGGGGSLLFGHPKSPVEVYNDIDTALVEFFQVIQHPQESSSLVEKLNLTLYSREIYNEFAESWHCQPTRLERVYRWYVVAISSYGGKIGEGWSPSKVTNKTAQLRNRANNLSAAIKRVRDVKIENETWETILDRYDERETFFYLDPPYVHQTRKSGEYRHEMTDDDHRRLVERLQRLEGYVMLSGYENEIYNELPWRTLETGVQASVVASKDWDGENNHRTEVVWTNYDPLFVRGWDATPC